MELSSFAMPALIHDDSLGSWQLINSGGFGKIYRAKHTRLKLDVAVKLLRYNDGSSSILLREADLMRHGGNPYVLRILGVYEGRPQGASAQLGLVMEYMERGSLLDLQRALNGPPPWPLAFRITHQIALGMNFLHQLDPPLLHLDLKPSNVLLDDSLNAKLTDFGLAKVAQSPSKMAKEEDDETGGTTSYMPPEAFQPSSYKPSFSSDIYSYGVLLWSVITGKEPYNTMFSSSLVRFRISRGDRPDLTAVDTSKASGLSELTELMKHCWHHNPNLRPSFMDCIDVTKKVYEMHKRAVNDDVYTTLKLLDGNNSSSLRSTQIPSKANNGSLKGHSPHVVKTEQTTVQEASGAAISRPKEPEPFVRTALPGTSHKPALKAPPINHKPLGTQRQHSTPAHVSINLSQVSAVQIGNNNNMSVNMPQERQRQRHLTAPSQVSLPNSRQPFRPNPHPKS
ncbi:receptor-interacting serine/threonine-protein kinase 3 [Salminus brasiliensis]|uniref:receptor-interacting serine/threonine-protein kinase 3 n=1 Tax=Salminus brasiliensis TaxID=930266 RepID=UPI003B835D3F